MALVDQLTSIVVSGHRPSSTQKRNSPFSSGFMGGMICYLYIGYIIMLSINSGGYQIGDAVGYNGTDQISTAKGGVVVVTISYRLGLFGFLSGKEVKKDGSLNAGLCTFLASSGYETWLISRIVDQQFALQWVQEHVSFSWLDPFCEILIDSSRLLNLVAILSVSRYGVSQRVQDPSFPRSLRTVARRHRRSSVMLSPARHSFRPLIHTTTRSLR
jgi:hypothetical protein